MSKKNIVIMQPMYFPWLGFFDLIRHSDVFVFYDDVQFPRRHFVNRVQLKQNNNSHWLTVPLFKSNRNALINQMMIDSRQEWQNTHLNKVRNALGKMPFYKKTVELMKNVFSSKNKNLSDLNIKSILEISDYLGLNKNTEFLISSKLNIEGSSSERLLNICKYLNGTNYITGHGARNYLDHDLFERNNLTVEYMNYSFNPWPQAYPIFSPYVSVLDAISSIGQDSFKALNSDLVGWRNFIVKIKYLNY